jgi:predicted DCC family thiol-disulfide oxidoreductase YuxK
MSESMGKNWKVEVFYDGECPLCLREIKMLRWMDRRENIRFTDIADPAFRPSDYGKTMQEFMSEIQGKLPDGSWIIGVEVFRRLYAAVGLGPLVTLTRLPGVSHGLDLSYRVFAKNRLRLTGRCSEGACEVN